MITVIIFLNFLRYMNDIFIVKRNYQKNITLKVAIFPYLDSPLSIKILCHLRTVSKKFPYCDGSITCRDRNDVIVSKNIPT